MKLCLLTLLAILPAFAQWDSIEMHFEGVGCASCIESLPSRLGRIRGVSDVKVDAAGSKVTVKLDSPNRVRLEQVRDFIQQDGTKVTRAKLSGVGEVAREEGRLTFHPDGQRNTYWLEPGEGVAAPEPGGRYRITGKIESMTPGDGRLVIRVVESDTAT